MIITSGDCENLPGVKTDSNFVFDDHVLAPGTP